MSKFHLPYPNYVAPFNLDFDTKLSFIGSCFSDSIAAIATSHGFNTLSNPFGTIFHPIPIIETLRAVIKDSEGIDFLDKKDFVTDWGSSHLLQSSNIQNHKKLILEKRQGLKRQLSGKSCLFITLGTSIGYRFLELNKIVANCHKEPSKVFIKENSGVLDMFNVWEEVVHELQSWNAELKIVFTLSPVRHIKDGLIENQRSKSRLSACLELLEERNDISYFPSFEFINDVLRDYRFYNDDLIHPNQQAINEVWLLFQQAYLTAQYRDISDRIFKVNQAKNHKTLQENKEEQKKLKDWIEKQNELIQKLIDQSS